jgi:hypothetical protein
MTTMKLRHGCTFRYRLLMNKKHVPPAPEVYGRVTRDDDHKLIESGWFRTKNPTEAALLIEYDLDLRDRDGMI